MSPADTPAERKAAERKRKREQGLVLKQVWVTPEAWPIISDLATESAERGVVDAHTVGGSYSRAVNENTGIDSAYVYELASNQINEILAQGEVAYGDKMASIFLANVIRAMIKIYNPEQKAMKFLVDLIHEETQ